MFMDAMKGQNKPSGRAPQALEYLTALYLIETVAKADLPAGQTRVDYQHWLRQLHSMSLLEAFEVWLDELALQTLTNSLLGKGSACPRNQWQYLSR